MRKILGVLFLSVMICSLAVAARMDRPVGTVGDLGPLIRASETRYLDVSCFRDQGLPSLGAYGTVSEVYSNGDVIPGRGEIDQAWERDGRLRFRLVTGKNYKIEVYDTDKNQLVMPDKPDCKVSTVVNNFDRNMVIIIELKSDETYPTY